MNWKEIYKDHIECIKRINEYLPKYKFGMEINWFKNTNEIPLDKLRWDLTKFIVPRMYYSIKDSELLSYLATNLKSDGVVITHTYENVTSNMNYKD